jgi:hypothetical protein
VEASACAMSNDRSGGSRSTPPSPVPKLWTSAVFGPPSRETPMPAATSLPRMTNAAFAGFLRLLLTPLNETPPPSRELGAYLRYLNSVRPRDETR